MVFIFQATKTTDRIIIISVSFIFENAEYELKIIKSASLSTFHTSIQCI